MQKIAIAMINHKGGVGKTTLAVILSQIALEEGYSVAAVDLDPQRNFTDAMSFVQNRYDSQLQISDQINDDGDVIMIDCPPALDKATATAIDYADIALIPVLPDLFSLSNLGIVYDFGQKHEKAAEQMPIVKIGYDKRGLAEIARAALDSRAYPIAGDIPLNRLIPFNLASGRAWGSGIPMPARKPYTDLYKSILAAYSQMLEGNFDVWGRE